MKNNKPSLFPDIFTTSKKQPPVKKVQYALDFRGLSEVAKAFIHIYGDSDANNGHDPSWIDDYYLGQFSSDVEMAQEVMIKWHCLEGIEPDFYELVWDSIDWVGVAAELRRRVMVSEYQGHYFHHDLEDFENWLWA